MVPSSIGPYRIIEGLGRGANGEVYLAEDTRLGRKVAVKTLAALDGADLADVRRWVLREARAAARLNHPNIASVYDVLESLDGAHIVMEYVPGHTLAERLQQGRLPVGQVLKIAIQLADALAEAHALGVVHRDLKPANVVAALTGSVKVLDFGLAQVRPTTSGSSTPLASSDHVFDGCLVGTPAYIPPEHLLGDPFDARGDIYSLGVMLYEMLTGHRPFLGTSSAALASAVLTDPTPRSRSVNPAVPDDLDAIVFRAMSRRPEDRYASAAELAADLRRSADAIEMAQTRAGPFPIVLNRRRWWLAVSAALLAVITVVSALRARRPPPPDRKSIAVLPLTNLSPDPENAYFSDGITEDIVVQLSKVADIKVISASAGRAYRASQQSAGDLARELGAATVLQGSVRRDGQRVRIVSKLSDATTSEQLWAGTYDRELKDIFAIQSEVAGRIAAALKGELSATEKARLEQRRTSDPDLFALYLKGRYHFEKRTDDDLRRSIALFEQVIDADSRYAPAYAGLADSYIALGLHGFVPRALARARAREAADTALRIDEGLADAHASLALVDHEALDWAAAEAEYRRAIELNPSHASARQWYALLLVQTGRPAEAIAEVKRARELDPLSLPINTVAGIVLALARRYDAAIDQLRATVEMEPGFAPAHGALGEAYTYAGRYDPAIAEIRKAIGLDPGNAQFLASLGYVYAVTGRVPEARKILEELKETSRSVPTDLGGVAAIHGALGEKDEAFAWLEKAWMERDLWVAYLGVEPKLDRLHSDPRFALLVRKVGLERRI